MRDLPGRDYERMLDLAVAVLESREPHRMWHLVGESIVSALHATTTIFVDLRWKVRTGTAEGWAPQWVGGTPLADLVQRRMRQRHPLFQHACSGQLAPTTVDSITERRIWRRSDAFNEAREIYGTTRQMNLPLSASGEVIRGFILGRPGADFSERDLVFATRVQPLLSAVDRHVRALGLLHHGAAALGPRKISPLDAAAQCSITPRELTVLALLAQGCTAAAMARRLAISPHTVNRHLESTYRKLSTHDRVTTMLQAQQLGLVPT